LSGCRGGQRSIVHQRTMQERVVEDFDEVGKLGNNFMSMDELEEVDIGGGDTKHPTYLNANLKLAKKRELCGLPKEFVGCIACDYTEKPGLGRTLVEHRLSIKPGLSH
jgi:hypothetical protein